MSKSFKPLDEPARAEKIWSRLLKMSTTLAASISSMLLWNTNSQSNLSAAESYSSFSSLLFSSPGLSSSLKSSMLNEKNPHSITVMQVSWSFLKFKKWFTKMFATFLFIIKWTRQSPSRYSFSFSNYLSIIYKIRKIIILFCNIISRIDFDFCSQLYSNSANLSLHNSYKIDN